MRVFMCACECARMYRRMCVRICFLLSSLGWLLVINVLRQFHSNLRIRLSNEPGKRKGGVVVVERSITMNSFYMAHFYPRCIRVIRSMTDGAKQNKEPMPKNLIKLVQRRSSTLRHDKCISVITAKKPSAVT